MLEEEEEEGKERRFLGGNFLPRRRIAFHD
jgi:hypothetical protein